MKMMLTILEPAEINYQNYTNRDIMAVTIEDNICNGISACPEGGLCTISCPTGAIKNKEDKPNVNFFSCVDCGICVKKCPNSAIIAARRS